MTTESKVRPAGLSTSGESAKESQQLAGRLWEKIIDLAQRARQRGITINEAERQIQDHKASSVSPRFAELIRRGDLVRVFVGYGRPKRRFPKGVPLYKTRYDEETKRNVNVYWVPEFAPATADSCSGPDRGSVEEAKSDAIRMGCNG